MVSQRVRNGTIGPHIATMLIRSVARFPMPYLLVALSSVFSIIASIALKTGGALNPTRTSWDGMLPYAVAVTAYGMGFGLYALALRKLQLSLAYPVMVALSMLGIFAYGTLWAHETVTLHRALGAGLIGTGIFLVLR